VPVRRSDSPFGGRGAARRPAPYPPRQNRRPNRAVEGPRRRRRTRPADRPQGADTRVWGSGRSRPPSPARPAPPSHAIRPVTPSAPAPGRRLRVLRRQHRRFLRRVRVGFPRRFRIRPDGFVTRFCRRVRRRSFRGLFRFGLGVLSRFLGKIRLARTAKRRNTRRDDHPQDYEQADDDGQSEFHFFAHCVAPRSGINMKEISRRALAPVRLA